MNRTSAIRTLVGAGMAISLVASGPGRAAGLTSTSLAGQPSPAPMNAVACAPGARACPIRITFAAGAYSGQSHSQLTGIRSQRWFVVRARAGQTMVVVVEGSGTTRGIVYTPNGHASGQPGGRVFDATVPLSGDYRIRVTESPMGEAWSGRVDVVVLIY